MICNWRMEAEQRLKAGTGLGHRVFSHGCDRKDVS